jgi:pimeloyl-ACP methyl ester carboxylesterase
LDVIDDAERYLDRRGLDRAHLAGNSMGGFVALELARRGRALTVCALSPGGFWSPDDRLRQQVMRRIRLPSAMTRRLLPVASSVVGSARLRRVAMRDVAHHPERITAAFACETVADIAGCTAVRDVFSTDAERVEPMDPLPCPITIAWAEHDSLLPLADYEDAVRQRIPGAAFLVLPGVGHVPMIDDPELVARTILAATRLSVR